MFRNKKILFVFAIVVCLQAHDSMSANSLKTAGKIASAVSVANTMWKAIKGDVKNDGSSDARIGLLLANQFLTMGNVDIAENGELYINGIAIKNADEGLVYIDQHAELLSPVFVQTGGYAALNQVLLEEAKGGAVIISQHLESRGTLNVGPNAKLEANSIKIVNETRGR